MPALLCIGVLTGCADEKPEDTLFVNRNANETGLDFVNQLTTTPELNILNYIYFYNGAGVATADFDRDGKLDLYFTSNQEEDRIYKNLGELKFEDKTDVSRIDNSGNWTNGVSIVDINQDGWPDIYISKLGDYKHIQGHNLLYINQGSESGGWPEFVEMSAEYGLDFKGFSTQSAFFDYDLDGDLDLFLMNHSVNPNQNYGRGDQRSQPDPLSGDKLFENKDGYFVDVSADSGIFESRFGYGLGISISDFDQNGYPDVYIGNDFFENDYLYLNQGDKTFKEVIHLEEGQIGHTSHFSMGNDTGDLDNDGDMDIVSVDMLPEDLLTYKSSGTEFSYQIYRNYLKNGYAPQYMQNTLQINLGDARFSESAYLSGLSATEWSWSPLIADFDLDGNQDIYVTNGILGATNDMDFINFIANENIQRALSKGVTERDLEFISKIPVKHTANYFFNNEGDLTFENTSEAWIGDEPSFSNGAIRADLDNDGDLDIVINNVNETAQILENRTNSMFPDRQSIRVELQGDILNRAGIGTKVVVYTEDQILTRENYPSRGYLSSQPSVLSFGLGRRTIDSLRVTWPDGKSQLITDPIMAPELVLAYSEADSVQIPMVRKNSPLTNTDGLFFAVHQDNPSLEFNRDPLIPYALSNEGPTVSVSDVDGDSLEDVFIGGAKGSPAQLWKQLESGEFELTQTDLFIEDRLAEDVDQAFLDVDSDGDPDLVVLAGGNEFTSGVNIQPRLYRNENGTLQKDSLQFDGIQLNGSVVRPADIDADGDMDLLFAADVIPLQFGSDPRHFIMINDGQGNFDDQTERIAPGLLSSGSITDAHWTDLDGDGDLDLITLGLWSAIQVWTNENGQLRSEPIPGLENTHGWWQSLAVSDLNEDGLLDIIAGNWGLNSRLQASVNQPVSLYSTDFDQNGNTEPIVTYYYQGVETVLPSKDELVKQLPQINKNYLSYADFAAASVQELFGSAALKSAKRKEVFQLASTVYINGGDGSFEGLELPFTAQLSSVYDIWVEDLNKDGFQDLFLVGNNFEISTQLSRLDASHGVLLINDRTGHFQETTNPLYDVPGPGRSIAKLSVGDQEYLVIARNDQPLLFLKK
ncbi:hypothetical protein BST85_02645 [Aureitalea marina]|uniref:ASPIC/UnbV domain-containing protein n=1 Tax=Aureitalea marina TaxID=930804 RepID=A0A2S7KTP5_9FLAO|nr:hypothetical protein BST85_02645 [Aureitalea marina]